MKNNILSVFLCMSSLSLTLVAADNNTFKPVEKFEELPVDHKGCAGIFIKGYQEKFKDSPFYNKDTKEIVESGFVKFYNDCKTNPSKEIPESSFSALIGSFMRLKKTPETSKILDHLVKCCRNDVEGKFDKKNLAGYGLQGLAEKIYATGKFCVGTMANEPQEPLNNDDIPAYINKCSTVAKNIWEKDFGKSTDLFPPQNDTIKYDDYCTPTPFDLYKNNMGGTCGKSPEIKNFRKLQNNGVIEEKKQ